MSILEIVSEICRLHDLRAKVMQDDDGRVYIFDCMHWTEECAYMLRFLLPNAAFSVESSVSSLSQFALVVRSESTAQSLRSSRQRMYLAAACTVLVYVLLLLPGRYYSSVFSAQ
jgi:hypothetical protein